MSGGSIYSPKPEGAANPYRPKRFLSLDSVLKSKFGAKVVKIPLNAGFSCPNRDGAKGYGGCIYCSPSLSGEFAGSPRLSLKEQFDMGKRQYHKKWGDTLYMAYLQAGTNTYAPYEKLVRVFGEAVSIPDSVGLSIATRADCVTPRAADLLADISEKTYLTVELGLQSSSEDTAKRINRGHTYTEFLAGYRLLAERGIKTCIHIINGLPGEMHEDMMQTARDIAALHPYEVKIHSLYIVMNTKAALMWAGGELEAMGREEYIKTVCDQLEILPPDTAIGRLTGDGDRTALLAPLWTRDKRSVLNGIDKELAARGSWQGIRYS